jgi:hypothetical protein
MARSLSRGARLAVALLVAGVLAGACGSAPPSASPTVAPTPRVTPNPHLPTPATAQQVFSGLGKAGIRVTANTATVGAEGTEVVTKIYATYLGWPLDVTQFSTAKALTEVTKWKIGEEPGRGEPPVALAGANILVTWGPTNSGKMPHKPDARQSEALHELVAALDILLSPLATRTNVPVKVTVPAPVPSPAASPKS